MTDLDEARLIACFLYFGRSKKTPAELNYIGETEC